MMMMMIGAIIRMSNIIYIVQLWNQSFFMLLYIFLITTSAHRKLFRNKTNVTREEQDDIISETKK